MNQKSSSMDAYNIIHKYYKDNPQAHDIIISHSEAVTNKAIAIAELNSNLKPDFTFIKEAGMLHDIGIIFTNAVEIFCFGKDPYLMHGYLGRRLLEKEGYPKHALVCENHIGVGITAVEIKEKNLPIPKRSIGPNTLEEKIICIADKFFSKSKKNLYKAKSLEEIRSSMLKKGEAKVIIFDQIAAELKLL